jgi:hypothetical protein
MFWDGLVSLVTGAPRMSVATIKERPALRPCDLEAIALIREHHLSYGYGGGPHVERWDLCWIDWMGGAPYVKLPIVLMDGAEPYDEVVVRVRAPARLHKKLAKVWQPTRESKARIAKLLRRKPGR